MCFCAGHWTPVSDRSPVTSPRRKLKLYGRVRSDNFARAFIGSAAPQRTRLDGASYAVPEVSATHTFANRRRQLWLVMRHMTAEWPITRIQGPSPWRQRTRWKPKRRSYFATLRPSTTPATLEK
jgi:hypothetical protein